jgi:hypothetical protein
MFRTRTSCRIPNWERVRLQATLSRRSNEARLFRLGSIHYGSNYTRVEAVLDHY